MAAIHEHLGTTATLEPLGSAVPRDWLSSYRGYDEVLRACADLVDAGARDEVIGHSVDGRPLFALEIGAPDADRVSVLMAGTHATEWIGVELGLALARALAQSPPVGRRVLYVPVLNVDGYCDVEADLRAGRRRYRRANRNGVDLNRNWPTHFRPFHLPGTLLPWLGKAGDRPRSEPEVDAVCGRLHDEVHRDAAVDRALSLHSIGRKLLFPYGGRWRPPTQVRSYVAAARTINHRMDGRYHAVQASRWLPGAFAHGLEIDHLHAGIGALSILVECSMGGLRLASPATWFTPFCWYNPARPREEIERVLPGLLPFLCG
jgi:hypothetical protein